MQKLLSEAIKVLDDQLDGQCFLDKGLHSDKNLAKCKPDGSVEGSPPEAAGGNTAGSSKMNRKEQQAAEVQRKLKILGQYGSPGNPPGFLSPASLRTNKPFQTPFRKPHNN